MSGTGASTVAEAVAQEWEDLVEINIKEVRQVHHISSHLLLESHTSISIYRNSLPIPQPGCWSTGKHGPLQLTPYLLLASYFGTMRYDIAARYKSVPNNTLPLSEVRGTTAARAHPLSIRH